ncbi:hypothetical protein MRX96_047050 [Rhipicephalus microplus]
MISSSSLAQSEKPGGVQLRVRIGTAAGRAGCALIRPRCRADATAATSRGPSLPHPSGQHAGAVQHARTKDGIITEQLRNQIARSDSATVGESFRPASSPSVPESESVFWPVVPRGTPPAARGMRAAESLTPAGKKKKSQIECTPSGGRGAPVLSPVCVRCRRFSAVPGAGGCRPLLRAQAPGPECVIVDAVAGFAALRGTAAVRRRECGTKREQ